MSPQAFGIVAVWVAALAPAPAPPAAPAREAAPAAAGVASCQARTTVDAPIDDCEKAPPPKPAAPDFGFMKTPSSPAFMALGLAPTSIERPTTPKGAAVAVATGVASAVGISPAENFAMEVTPYWTVPHPEVTAEALLNQGREAIYRNASVSLAVVRGASSGTSTTMATGTAVPDTRASLGVRTTLWPGAPSQGALACQRYLRAYLDGVVVRMTRTRLDFLRDWDKAHPQPAVATPDEPDPARFPPGPEGDAALDAAIMEWKKKLEQDAHFVRDRQELVRWRAERRQALASYMAAHPSDRSQADAVAQGQREDPMLTTCLDLIHDRRGLLVDLAGAATLTAPGGDLKTLSSEGRYGMQAWLTGGWVTGTGVLGAAAVPTSWSLLGSLHVEHDVVEPGGGTTTKLDAGGRGIWAWGRFGLWLEGGYRHQTDANLYKATVGFDLRIAGSTWVDVVVGKDFGLASGDKPILALANVQWAFGPERKLLPDTTVSQ
jgi:hypothetical protein